MYNVAIIGAGPAGIFSALEIVKRRPEWKVILVEKGQEMQAGEPVVIVEAMKMQSEYKVKRDCKIKDILVKEGDTIDGNQTLVTLE